MIFYPLKNEVNLLELLDDNKEFYLPKVKENNIEVCPYKKGDFLKTSIAIILRSLIIGNKTFLTVSTSGNSGIIYKPI